MVDFFYNAKSGKYHSPKKHHFPWELSLSNLWVVFYHPSGLTVRVRVRVYEGKKPQQGLDKGLVQIAAQAL